MTSEGVPFVICSMDEVTNLRAVSEWLFLSASTSQWRTFPAVSRLRLHRQQRGLWGVLPKHYMSDPCMFRWIGRVCSLGNRHTETLSAQEERISRQVSLRQANSSVVPTLAVVNGVVVASLKAALSKINAEDRWTFMLVRRNEKACYKFD